MTKNPTIERLIRQQEEAERVMMGTVKIPDARTEDRTNWYGYGQDSADWVGPLRRPDGSVFHKTPPAPMPGTTPLYKPNLLDVLLDTLKIKPRKLTGEEVKPLPGSIPKHKGFI